MPRRPQPLRIAIDTGGTFTDCVWIDPTTRRLRMLKVFSIPSDPSQAIVEALKKIAHDGELILLHGTTVGTNTLLQRRGARTALVTTAGFEDVLEIGRQARPKLYDFFFDRIQPLVPRDLRFGINERTASDAKILTSPTSEELLALVKQIEAAKPQAIAISLLFSFANPKNEEAIAAALNHLAVPLSISHQILPEFREYERTSTVVINAYLQPVMQHYLQNLEKNVADPQRPKPGLSGQAYGADGAVPYPGALGVAQRFSAASRIPRKMRASAPEGHHRFLPRIFIMQSSGGIAALSTAAREPVRTVLSGPAGGVVGAAATARSSGFQNIIAFDMGGTSTDVSLIEGENKEGEIKTASDAHIAGLPISVPMLDIHTVGAGGGSLARFDAAGVLHVGPESAGADPGPICYGRGAQPTVTDANLLLGRLQPTRFLGGDFKLDLDRTRRITQEWLKKQPSKLTLVQFAAGVIRVINGKMERAIRLVSIERGRDPRRFALVAFGGAGGLHACALAEALSIPQVIIPAFPGALSAFGILTSNVVKDYSRTVLWRIAGKIPHAQLNQEFDTLKKIARTDLRHEAWQGSLRYVRSVDLRYRGQGYELNLALTKNLLSEFEREHFRRYGYAHPNREVELVTLRLRATIATTSTRARWAHVGTAAPSRPGRAKLGGMSAPPSPVQFDGRNLPTKIYQRDDLQPARKYSGPAIITEYSATTVIPPRARFGLDRADNLIVTIP